MAGFLISVGKAGEVAERSPAVISANLKEDMLLQKKIVILNRSERSVVHQIKVDQKVLYKRFQSRLVRSKLTFSRIMGHKDTEKELRSRNIGGLNTDIVGCGDEEYSFLDKLEHRPCTATGFSPRLADSRRRRTSGGAVHPLPRARAMTSHSEERASSARGRLEVIPEKGTVSHETESKDRNLRPATTLGLRLSSTMLLQNRKKGGNMSPIAENVELITETNEKTENHRDQTIKSFDEKETENASENGSTTNSTERENKLESEKSEDENQVKDSENKEQTVGFLEHMEMANGRPKSMGNMKLLDESPPISPRQLSRRASKAADFFQEEKKVDLVSLRLREARARDYTDRVAAFCEEIEELINAPDRPTVDYYASRLEAAAVERLSRPPTAVPGTPEDENRRAVGNISIRSLTVPVLNLDY